VSALTPQDRDDLRMLATRYAMGVDRRDAEMFGSAFHPDAQLHTFTRITDEPTKVYDGRDQIATIPSKMVGRYDATFHAVHQCHFEATADGATGEVYCTASHFGGSAAVGGSFVMYIRYRDTYTRAPDGSWGIARREVHTDWTETTP
jgi:hypothetical protein